MNKIINKISNKNSNQKKGKKVDKRPKLVLAYSGGLDTSVICKWLDEKGYNVICYVANVGQRENYLALKKKAMLSGAKKVVVDDVQKHFVEDFVYPAIAFNSLYEGRYLLGTSLARPVISEGMVEVMKKEGATIFAHGATGKGNDQVRFELTAYALMPKLEVIAPWRIAEFNQLIKGRKEAIAYAKKHGIPIKATKSEPWSSDENLLHISFEAGVLEDPSRPPPEKMFSYTVSPEKAPNRATSLSIDFEKGYPVAVNGKKMRGVELLTYLNTVGGKNGIGRVDMVESRFVGLKSRGVYETPGGTILLAAHRDLEGLTLSRDLIQLKDSLMPRFASLVYNGLWYSSEVECLLSFLKTSQKKVTGTVKLKLYKGNVTVLGRTAKSSLYDENLASMDDDGGAYDQADAEGFIRLNALPLIAERRRK